MSEPTPEEIMIEEYIASLTWVSATDYEKTLVAGNLRAGMKKAIEWARSQ